MYLNGKSIRHKTRVKHRNICSCIIIFLILMNQNHMNHQVQWISQYLGELKSTFKLHADESAWTLLCSQESAKVSDLNPNAKAWANHMFSLDPSGSADTTPAALQPWKEGSDSSADPGPEGQPVRTGNSRTHLASACNSGWSEYVWIERKKHKAQWRSDRPVHLAVLDVWLC